MTPTTPVASRCSHAKSSYVVPPALLGPLFLQRRKIRVLFALGTVQSVDDSVGLFNAALEDLALVFVSHLSTTHINL